MLFGVSCWGHSYILCIIFLKSTFLFQDWGLDKRWRPDLRTIRIVFAFRIFLEKSQKYSLGHISRNYCLAHISGKYWLAHVYGKYVLGHNIYIYIYIIYIYIPALKNSKNIYIYIYIYSYIFPIIVLYTFPRFPMYVVP